MRRITSTFIAWFGMTVAFAAQMALAAQDTTALSLVINPRTGAASIRNDTNTAVNIDGYLLTSGQSVFNPATWQKLTGNPSFPGWEQGPAATNRLGEGSLQSSFSVTNGAPVSLGSPYIPFTPTQIGQIEPGLKFAYSVAGVSSVEGDVVFSPMNSIALLVNPLTGKTSLQNQSNFDVSIDGILITSTAGVLDPVGWNGFAESGQSGWEMGPAQTNRIGEGNLFGSRLLAANGAPVDIGFAVNPGMLHDETELKFEYHVATGGTLPGGVAFVASAAPPVVLGDYNGNGRVDTADYVVWRDNIGASSLPNRGGGITGVVGQADYNYWRAHFGATSGSGSSSVTFGSGAGAVPEPSAGLLVFIAAALVPVRSDRKSRGA